MKQAGVDHAVGILNGGEHDLTMFQLVGSSGWAPDTREEAPWSRRAIEHDEELFEQWGFDLVAIEDTAPIDKVRLGTVGRDERSDKIIL